MDSEHYDYQWTLNIYIGLIQNGYFVFKTKVCNRVIL